MAFFHSGPMLIHCGQMEVSWNGDTQNSWFMMDNPITMDDLGVPPPIFTNPPNDCMCGIVQEAMSKCHNIGIFDLQYSAAFLQQSWRMSEQSYLINPIIDHIMSLTVFLSFSFTKQNKTYKTRDTHGSRNRNSTELLPGRSLPEGRSSATSSNHTLNHQKKTFWHLKLRDGS